VSLRRSTHALYRTGYWIGWHNVTVSLRYDVPTGSASRGTQAAISNSDSGALVRRNVLDRSYYRLSMPDGLAADSDRIILASHVCR